MCHSLRFSLWFCFVDNNDVDVEDQVVMRRRPKTIVPAKSIENVGEHIGNGCIIDHYWV